MYESPHCYYNLQDVRLVAAFYGMPELTKEEAIELARKTIKKIGYSLEDVLADMEPSVPPLPQVGTNVIPHYRITWLDPRSGGKVTEVEIDARRKVVESLRFEGIVALRRVGPKVKVRPSELPANHPWRRMNELGELMNPDYAWRLVPVVFKAAENWVRKLDLGLPIPITTNQVKRFYCSNNGGSPYVQMTLTNDWQFIFRHDGITCFGSPRRFFDSDPLPFRPKNYIGQ